MSSLLPDVYVNNNSGIDSTAENKIRNARKLIANAEDVVKFLQQSNDSTSSSRLSLNSLAIITHRAAKQKISFDNSILKLLTDSLLAIEDSESPPHVHDLAMILYGVGCSELFESNELRQFQLALASKFKAISEVAQDANSIGMMLFSLRNMSSHTREVQQLLSAIYQHVLLPYEHGFSNEQHVCNSLYGMRKMSSDHPEVRDIVGFLAKTISRMKSSLSFQSFCYALNGMRGLDSNHQEVSDLVQALNSKVDITRNGKVTGQFIAQALLGCQNLNPARLEVRKLLSSLHTIISQNDVFMTALEFSSSLNGMRNMSSKDDCVKAILSTLSRHMKYSLNSKHATAESFKLNSGGMTLMVNGLQGIHDNDIPEVTIVNDILRIYNYNAHLKYNSLEICHLLYGLRRQNSVNDDVRRLIWNISQQIPLNSPQSYSAIKLSNACFAMRGMSSHASEVRYLLFNLNDVICKQGPKGRYSEIDLTRILKGMQLMHSFHFEIRQFLQTLTLHLNNISTCQIGNVLFAVSGMFSMSNRCQEVEDLLDALMKKLDRKSLSIQGTLLSYNVASAFRGLRSLSSSSLNSLLLAETLSTLLCHVNVDSNSVSKILSGVGGFIDVPVGKINLEIMVKHIEDHSLSFSARELHQILCSMTIHGSDFNESVSSLLKLLRLNEDETTVNYLEYIELAYCLAILSKSYQRQEIESLLTSFENCRILLTDPPHPSFSFFQNIVNMSSLLKLVEYWSNVTPSNKYLKTIATKLSSNDLLKSLPSEEYRFSIYRDLDDGFMSRFAVKLTEHLHNDDCNVEEKCHIHGFDVDFVIRSPDKEHIVACVAIVDSTQHSKAFEYFNIERRKYFQQIQRIPIIEVITDKRNYSDDEIKAKIELIAPTITKVLKA